MWQFEYIAYHSKPYVVLILIYVELEAARRSEDEQSHVLLSVECGKSGRDLSVSTSPKRVHWEDPEIILARLCPRFTNQRKLATKRRPNLLTLSLYSPSSSSTCTFLTSSLNQITNFNHLLYPTQILCSACLQTKPQHRSQPPSALHLRPSLSEPFDLNYTIH